MAHAERLTIKTIGFDPQREATLVASKLDRNPQAAVDSVRENLRAYDSELLQDKPITFFTTYLVQYGGGLRIADSPNILSEKSLIEKQIDKDERDGLPLSWWQKTEREITAKVQNGEQAIYVGISPRGKAGTRGIYAEIDYPYHQVYIGAVGRGGKIRNWALKMDVLEEVLRDWLNTVAGRELVKDTSIPAFFAQPLVVGPKEGIYTPHQLLDILAPILEAHGVSSIYTSRDGQTVSVSRMKQMLSEEKGVSPLVASAVKIVERRIYETGGNLSVSELSQTLTKAYVYLLYHYAQDGVTQVSGCVGTVNLKTLAGQGIIFVSALEKVLKELPTSLASIMRLVDALGAKFECPACHGVTYGRVGNACPKCSITAKQWGKIAARRGQAVCM